MMFMQTEHSNSRIRLSCRHGAQIYADKRQFGTTHAHVQKCFEMDVWNFAFFFCRVSRTGGTCNLVFFSGAFLFLPLNTSVFVSDSDASEVFSAAITIACEGYSRYTSRCFSSELVKLVAMGFSSPLRHFHHHCLKSPTFHR
jgi:hypothetical protein